MARRYISLGHLGCGTGSGSGITHQKKIIPSTANFLFLTCLGNTSSNGAENFKKIQLLIKYKKNKSF